MMVYDLEKISRLLASGYGINTRGWHGRTLLWQAAFGGNCEATRFLLEHGADPSITDSFGDSPLDIACTLCGRGYREPGEVNPYIHVIALLKQYTPELNSQYPTEPASYNSRSRHHSRQARVQGLVEGTFRHGPACTQEELDSCCNCCTIL